MNEGEQLLAYLRAQVAAMGVPPEIQPVVVEAAARTVMAVLSNPHYLTNLAVVRQLLAQQAPVLRSAAPRKAPAKRAPAKKAAPRKAPTVSRTNQRAFKKGARGK